MSFIFVSADAADQRFRATAGTLRPDATSADYASKAAVRRPHRGIQIKDDTYATLSVFDAKGRPILLDSSSSTQSLTDSGGVGKVDQYADFILQSIRDERVEKQQILETFGDSFIFFFGERPRIVSMTGLLMNTEDFNWRSQFWANYESTLRGTKLVERNARAFLSYDSIVISGYPIQAVAETTSDDPYMVRFSMSMFLTDYTDFSNIGGTDFPGTADNAEELAGALNRELEFNARVNFSNQDAQDVRLLNLQEGLSGGFSNDFGLSRGLREVTRLTNSVFGGLSIARTNLLNLYNGRVISKPIGAAGFLAQIGQQALVAQQSVSAQFLALAAGAGLVQVQVPRRTNYVAPAILRGRISDNVDEYPLLDGISLGGTSTFAQQLAFRKQQRALAGEQQRAELALINLQAKTERTVLRGIAHTFEVARTGFTMVKTAQAIANDPVAAAANAFGLGEVQPGQKRIANASGAVDLVMESGQPPLIERRIATSAGSVDPDFENFDPVANRVRRALGETQAERAVREVNLGVAYADSEG